MQVILGEEVAASKLTLFDITKQIADAVQARAEHGSCYLVNLFSFFIFSYALSHAYVFGSDKYHGVILLPEGLIESIPEVYALLKVNSQHNTQTDKGLHIMNNNRKASSHWVGTATWIV